MRVSPPEFFHGYRLIHSQIDQSVNFVSEKKNAITGATTVHLECRLVLRDEPFVTVYLSSQTGCKQACRFCHLTATGQTNDGIVPIAWLIQQANTVLGYYKIYVDQGETSYRREVKFDFMARGEPLLNDDIVYNFSALSRELHSLVRYLNFDNCVFHISTILPQDFNVKRLLPKSYLGPEDSRENMFGTRHTVRLFYSLYSVNPVFRKKWLPKAHDITYAMLNLASFRQYYRNIHDVILHWAFIEGENDSDADVAAIIDHVEVFNLANKHNPIQVNIVRFNPPPGSAYKESPTHVIEKHFCRLLDTIANHATSKIVQRVGEDVQASCGMFAK
jgi:23S rRNA (adenine2503-C2)-methyltransferase